ncbi:MAG: sigma-54 dependent transcriptional regulator [Syntrophobacteraceae bacterium]|jgi:two-component system response regulator AtoC|nr:sigma-54 dependent transcriptional regulator [Syntrophobacteraceae bacterium]
MSQQILIVDDEQDFLDSVRRALLLADYRNVVTRSSPLEAAALVQEGEHFDLALLDMRMPGMSGFQLLEVIKGLSPETECLMITALNEAKLAVDCLRKGAYDYLVKPVMRDELLKTIERALERKRLLDIVNLDKRIGTSAAARSAPFAPIVTASRSVLKVLREAELHGASHVPVLITGESGTGKELLARAIHESSPRAGSTYSVVNMAALSATLFDAEFFGHTKGAFTGAERNRSGYLENAHRGSLFLDEIGNLPLELQGKLLRVLQEGEFTKLGTSSAQKVDVRFIAATNMDLEKLMARGAFRKDLYYRLQGAWLHLPPLRERREDIPLLIDHFLGELSRSGQSFRVDPEAIGPLLSYGYPGNIRELRAIIHSAANLARGDLITLEALPEKLREVAPAPRAVAVGGPCAPRSLAEVEKSHILEIYQQTDGNKSLTARLLDIGLNTLRRRLELYGVP